DALPGLESSDVFANFDDFSRNVAAQNVRQVNPGQAFAHPEVEVVHGASLHTYQHLIFAGSGIGDIFVAQNFRSAKLVDADSFHRLARSEIKLSQGRAEFDQLSLFGTYC